MNLNRIIYLRGELEAERISWGEVAELGAAFNEINPTELREPPEHASGYDMLDELEARAT